MGQAGALHKGFSKLHISLSGIKNIQDCDMTTTAAIANNITEYERKKYIKECLAMESLYANQLSRLV